MTVTTRQIKKLIPVELHIDSLAGSWTRDEEGCWWHEYMLVGQQFKIPILGREVALLEELLKLNPPIAATDPLP